ncbi:hypothetical protein PG996_003265 [Apiospora saccharicola]|uniref:Uncharacterized protein n=1 Tax=Apiospora saccharicola TaxID=335842 RepID=A0ABR1W0S1_9PEZI
MQCPYLPTLIVSLVLLFQLRNAMSHLSVKLVPVRVGRHLRLRIFARMILLDIIWAGLVGVIWKVFGTPDVIGTLAAYLALAS